MPGRLMPFRTHHLLMITTIVAIGAFNYTLWDRLSVAAWSGGFDLRVVLRGQTATPIKSITAIEIDNNAHLELIKKHPDSIEWSHEQVSLHADRSFHLYIKTAGKLSSKGRELSYHQPKYLGLVLTLEDGTTRRLWVELPDGRERKEVEVDVTP